MPEQLSNIDRIIIRYLINEADSEEKEYLLNWLKKEIQNRHHFFAFKDTWEKSQKNITGSIRTGDSWASLKEQIDKESIPININRLHKKLTLRIMKYVAIILVVSLIGAVAWVISQRFTKTEKPVQFTEIYTEKGQKKEITLPDGSKVWLNSGTSFRYSNDYGNQNREVYLEGEAFFDVTRDKAKIFIVRAGEVTIRVLGTSFNVNCYPENRVVETTVLSGVVSIANGRSDTGSNVIILNKLEKGTYIKDQQKMMIENSSRSERVKPIIGKIELSGEEAGYISSWKDQTLSFNNETLEEMALKLQRWFNISIRIEDENLKSYRYKGKFENVRSIFQVLEVVKLATPITYEYNQQTKEISIKEIKN